MGKIITRFSAAILCALFFMGSPYPSPRACAEGQIASLKDFEYWDNGKIKTCTVYDIDGHLKAKTFCLYDGTVEKTERYDPSGNKIEEALYDQNGRLRKGFDGWAAMRWWYDGIHLMSQISYDEYGRPIERKRYSDGGSLILRQFREDVKADPYEEASMWMLLGSRNVAYYDPVERLKETESFIKN